MGITRWLLFESCDLGYSYLIPESIINNVSGLGLGDEVFLSGITLVVYLAHELFVLREK